MIDTWEILNYADSSLSLNEKNERKIPLRVTSRKHCIVTMGKFLSIFHFLSVVCWLRKEWAFSNKVSYLGMNWCARGAGWCDTFRMATTRFGNEIYVDSFLLTLHLEELLTRRPTFGMQISLKTFDILNFAKQTFEYLFPFEHPFFHHIIQESIEPSLSIINLHLEPNLRRALHWTCRPGRSCGQHVYGSTEFV